MDEEENKQDGSPIFDVKKFYANIIQYDED